MEYRYIEVSSVDQEYRAFQRQRNRELLSIYAITPSRYLKVMLENADKRLRATKRRRGVLSQAWTWLSKRIRYHGKG